MNFSGLQSLMV